MKSILQSVVVFLLVFFWFLIAGTYIIYEIRSPFGFITGSLVIMFGLVIAGIIVAVTHNKAKRKANIRQVNRLSNSFNSIVPKT